MVKRSNGLTAFVDRTLILIITGFILNWNWPISVQLKPVINNSEDYFGHI